MRRPPVSTRYLFRIDEVLGRVEASGAFIVDAMAAAISEQPHAGSAACGMRVHFESTRSAGARAHTRGPRHRVRGSP